MSANQNLGKARKQKNDEFYTRLTDIEKELKHYKNHFRDKVVYCNCDDPTMSNFFQFFWLNFNELGLKRLITTCYKSQNHEFFSRHDQEKSIGIELAREKEDSPYKLPAINVFHLKGDGDFRNQECIELLKQSDIVVTNPPFSLFREYVAQLIECNKKFLILGNMNAITYREVFKFIKEKRVWLGATGSGSKWFEVNPNFEIKTKNAEKIEDGKRYVVMGNVMWFTNLDHYKRHEELILYKKYSPSEYSKYENYDAINVDKTKNIPMDYSGMMGTPISFLDKYNPDQFEIIGIGIAGLGKSIGVKPYTPEHKKYRREVQKRGAVDGDLYMIENGEVKVPYRRIIIRNKRL